MAAGDLNLSEIKELIKARAFSLGFCLCGVTTNQPLENFCRYENWLKANYHGEMSYLASERHLSLRQDPIRLAPWVKSIIVFAWPYLLNRSTSTDLGGQIAGYAGDIDYHLLVPNKIHELVDDLPALFARPIQTQIFCDSSPLLERELAVRAGLGWIGRNSCVISPQHGSAFVLAELFLDKELPADLPFTQNLCGKCHTCLDACPTQCILAQREIDARHCISTLTIENKNLIPSPEIAHLENHLFGCDICQSTCPWNQKVMAQSKALAQMDEAEMIAELTGNNIEFKSHFQNSAIYRAKRRGWVRNLCAVISNLQLKNASESLIQVFASDQDAVCRASAAAALASLDPCRSIPLIMARQKSELDPLVLAKIEQIINENPL